MGTKVDATPFEMNFETIHELNIREKFKAKLRPIDYYKELDKIDFDSLGEGDRFYLQDFGIYNNELTDDEFMLRLRFPGGRISNQNLQDISKIVKKYDLYIILTARAGMQLHGLTCDNILDAYKNVQNCGINSWQSFGDNIRNIASDVFDGIGKYNIIEVAPYIAQMQDFILKVPEYVGLLPRRISTGISGSYANGGSFFASDLYFALAKKDGKYGFNIYMGGKNTELAVDADIFLYPEEVVDFFKAFVKTFNKYGLRFERDRTRLFHLLEDIGLDTYKNHIKQEYKKQWQSSGEILLEKVVFEDFEELKNGTFSFCYHSNFARIEADEIENIANFSIENNLEVRLGTDQQLYIMGLKNKSIPFSHYNENRTIVACAGSEYCPYSYWNIKEETQYLPLARIEKNKILIGFSGCLKGCAKHQHSDIGIVGLRSNYFGEPQKTARIYLGAQYSFGKAVARAIFQVVPLKNLKELLEYIVDEFENSSYDDFEEFSLQILNKFSVDFLTLWFLAKIDTRKICYLTLSNEQELIKDNFGIEKDFKEAIEELTLKLFS